MTMGGRRIRGHEEHEILMSLADGQMSYKEIADYFDRGEQTIYNFATANRAKITKIKNRTSDETDYIWLAKKNLRLKEMESKYGDLQELLEDMEDQRDCKQDREDCGHHDHSINAALYVKIVAQQQSLMKQAAEEMGHLPTRLPNEGAPPERVEWVVTHEDREEKEETK